MIKFEKFTLDNGLRVIVHKDKKTPVVAMNILYDVGARDEDSDKTGFAHLFEHLMFGGSVNIPKYDEPLERIGGENNAFTNNDFTNYYLVFPKQNIETAFWLESDRMLSLSFSKRSLNVQKKVVIEEFKQSHLNQPYGDIWMLLRPLAFTVHPYKWSTIGIDISHIANAKIEDVKHFFYKHYSPSNAILTIAGNVEIWDIKKLCDKWFAPISSGEKYIRSLPSEPEQLEPRKLTVERKVPFDVIYKAYQMCDRFDRNYYVADIISDILSNGKSSRLYLELVKKRKLFSEVNAYHLGHIDKSSFIVNGYLLPGITMEQAEEGINCVLKEIKENIVPESELTKIKNKMESNFIFSEISLLNRAMSLAYFELLGDTNLINTELDIYKSITQNEIKSYSNIILNENSCSTLYYLSKK